MTLKQTIKGIYEDKYKVMLMFSLLLLILAFVQIGVQTALTGDFVHRGITLKGGSTITIENTDLNPEELQQYLHQEFPSAEINVRTIYAAGKVVALAIDSDAQDTAEINHILKALNTKIDLKGAKPSVEVMGAALGSSFFKQAGIALIISFILMALVVLLYFRLWIPSLAVIACAFSDIVVTMAVFNLTGIKLSTAGVAGFLMLIGYSIDTDILLTTRVLKRHEGTVMDRIYSSISTGMTMTVTTICVVLVALIFVQSETIRQILIIVLIGMFVDMIMTWIQNVAFLRLYLEKKKISVK